MGKSHGSMAGRIVKGAAKGTFAVAKGTVAVARGTATVINGPYVGGNKHNAKVARAAGRTRMAEAVEMERRGQNPHNVQLMKDKAARQMRMRGW
jgi:hypothetical protein